ncbi:SCO family protein [Microvirga yunnanensis]|uniref:SCO family protein n=1 Tax=Microvirga yunnanensis TaxID=2953740 RepID=UPI0021C79919|nr:SCO family protein [Microvirga sp. HBU65207]
MPSLAVARLVLATVLCGVSLAASAHDLHERKPNTGQATSPSTGYAFALPEPGSYRLPAIRPAAGGRVLDEHGQGHDLTDILQGRITVLAFMYTRCGDICPTATLQLSLLQDLAAKDEQVARRTHLVSLSFDPEHDTPAVLAEYAADWRSDEPGAPDWVFLTARDRNALAPVLAAYGQMISAKPDPGAAGGPLYHIFRAFLIDASGRIRNIYSLDFLDPDLVLTDIRTLILDQEKEQPVTDPAP